MSFDGDGVGAWPTGSHNEGTPLDVDALDEATRSQFEFLVSFLCHGNACACTAPCAQRLQRTHVRWFLQRQRRERIRSLLADDASSQRPQPGTHRHRLPRRHAVFVCVTVMLHKARQPTEAPVPHTKRLHVGGIRSPSQDVTVDAPMRAPPWMTTIWRQQAAAVACMGTTRHQGGALVTVV